MIELLQMLGVLIFVVVSLPTFLYLVLIWPEDQDRKFFKKLEGDARAKIHRKFIRDACKRLREKHKSHN